MGLSVALTSCGYYKKMIAFFFNSGRLLWGWGTSEKYQIPQLFGIKMTVFALFEFVKWAIYITITMDEPKEPTSLCTHVFDQKSEQWPGSTLVKVE